MFAFVVSFLVGALCVGIGISNRKGNIESLHSYHRNRVSEQDRLPFGKRVGLGMILVGCGIMVQSVCSTVALYVTLPFLTWLGYGALIGGIVIGLAIAFHAMRKYNKGIF